MNTDDDGDDSLSDYANGGWDETVRLANKQRRQKHELEFRQTDEDYAKATAAKLTWPWQRQRRREIEAKILEHLEYTRNLRMMAGPIPFDPIQPQPFGLKQ